MTNTDRIRVAMIGGGPGAMIGETHRLAMRIDGRFDLVAGQFSRQSARNIAAAAAYGVDPSRVYSSVEELVDGERGRPDRADLVIVVTPNTDHHAAARRLLSAGFHLVLEKPVTTTSAEAQELDALARANGLVLAVPHVYSAYAMVREAAYRVQSGMLGTLRRIDVEHASGWAATRLEMSGHKQAAWRMDPDGGGRLVVVGDLGTHAYHLARFISGVDAETVTARLHTLVPGRHVFDDVTAELVLDGGTTVRLWASMAATGHAHGLRIRVFGSTGSLEWIQEDPHHLRSSDLDANERVISQGTPELCDEALRLTRVGLGHPEGFLEAFANFYGDIADDLTARRSEAQPQHGHRYPDSRDGLLGMDFIEAVGRSHDAGGAAVPIHHQKES